jgi:hypothetical protein
MGFRENALLGNGSRRNENTGSRTIPVFLTKLGFYSKSKVFLHTFLKGSAESLKKTKKVEEPQKSPSFFLGAYRRIQSRA